MRNTLLFVLSVLVLSVQVRAGEEKIRGLLEKTTKTDASAQITDALNDVYFLEKNDATEKLVANFVGKAQRVVVTGTVETKPNDTHFYVSVKNVEPFTPKMPPAPPPPPPPPAAEKKEEPKKEEAKKDEPKVEAKKEEPKPEAKKDDTPKVEVKKDEEKKEQPK